MSAARYEEVFVQPVKRLKRSLNEVLDVDTDEGRTPEQAMGMLKQAIETFQEESEHWL